MTIVVSADDNTLEQVRKQLGKLVPVVKVRDFREESYVERDLAMATIAVGPEKRNEVIEIVNLFRGHVVDGAKNSLMVQLAGTEDKIEAVMELLRPYGIKEMARPGVIAMARGSQKEGPEAKQSAPKTRTRSKDAPSARSLSCSKRRSSKGTSRTVGRTAAPQASPVGCWPTPSPGATGTRRRISNRRYESSRTKSCAIWACRP